MGKKGLTNCTSDHCHLPGVQLGQHLYPEPMAFRDGFEIKPCVILAIASDKAAVVSPTFARYSMKLVPGGNTY